MGASRHRFSKKHREDDEGDDKPQADDVDTSAETLAYSRPPNPASPQDPESVPTKKTVSAAGVDCGSVIDQYTLIEILGEGGFGVVFRAEQSHPVRRQVALKILKQGMDTAEVISRFEAERQALAMMDHPHIAKVYDAGATTRGRPYFVMELAQGSSIRTYCDRQKLTIRERLELFINVCRAVQHAHQKGIIHRDLKPSNILIVRSDGKPVPKVIDFGVAKAIEQKLSEQTLVTREGLAIGTPIYMSPEQLNGILDIDTRSDIYSLGVVLYELLTGVTPVSREQFKAASFTTFEHLISDCNFGKPSSRIKEDKEQMEEIVAQRSTDLARLLRSIRGDLDLVVMKALETDRDRRYETANALALELRRYLDDEPVNASPPSTAYRMQKFARRNRGFLAATGAVLVALVIGLIASITLTIRATRGEAEADRQRQLSDLHTQAAIAQNLSRTMPNEALELARNTATAYQDLEGKLSDDIVSSLLNGLEFDRLVAEWRVSGTGLAVTPDGEHILIAASNGKVHLVDYKKRSLGNLFEFADLFHLAVASDGSLIATNEKGEIGIWNKHGQPIVQPWNAHSGPTRVFLVDASEGDFEIVSIGRSGEAKRWNREGKSSGEGYRVDFPRFVASASNPDRLLVIPALSVNLSLTARRTRTGEKLASFPLQTTLLSSAAISPDGRWLATGSVGAELRLWNGTNYRPERVVPGHGSEITAITFDPSSKVIVSGSREGEIRFNTLHGEILAPPLKGGAKSIIDLKFIPSANHLVSLSEDDNVRVWDTGGLRSRPDQTFPGRIRHLAFSGDESRFAIGLDGGDLFICEAELPGSRIGVRPYESFCGPLEWAKGGQLLVVANERRPVCRIVNSAGEQQGDLLQLKSGPILQMKRDHRTSLIHGWTKEMAWVTIDPENASVVAEEFPEGLFTPAEDRGGFLPSSIDDSGRIALGSPSFPGFMIFDVDKRNRLHRIESSSKLALLAWNRETDRLVAYRSPDQILGFRKYPFSEPDWAIATGFHNSVTGLGISSDGQVLAVGAMSGQLRFFSNDGSPLGPILLAHHEKIRGLVPLGQSEELVTWGDDGAVRFWTFGLESWLRLAAQRLRKSE